MLTIGTSYFLHHAAAVAMCGEDAVREGRALIGRPTPPEGFIVVLNTTTGRYSYQEKPKWKHQQKLKSY